MTLDLKKLAGAIEHTILRPEATPADAERLCDEAVEHGFIGVCVNPVYVRLAADHIAAAPRRPLVIAAVGFPLGASRSDTKADEARRAMDDGAVEIDMVARIGELVSGHAKAVRRDIEAVAAVVHRAAPPGVLKVILETGVLDLDQLILGCRCCAEGEADFVKTSTGFHPRGGATVEHVRLLHRHAAPLRVKAAGGIRTAAAAWSMLQAGAVRIGTSSGLAIMAEAASHP
jgi:deoxyribose-phosphate aldolase